MPGCCGRVFNLAGGATGERWENWERCERWENWERCERWENWERCERWENWERWG